MDARPPFDLDLVLADQAFVRRFARALVRDPELASMSAATAGNRSCPAGRRAGTFVVRIEAGTGTPKSPEREVVVDGVNDIALEFDWP